MTKNNIKIRIIACVLALITAFSVGAITVTTASAAASNQAVVRQVSINSFRKTVEQFFAEGIDGVTLKKDTSDTHSSVSATAADKTVIKDNVICKLNKLIKAISHDHNIVMVCFRIIGMVFCQS